MRRRAHLSPIGEALSTPVSPAVRAERARVFSWDSGLPIAWTHFCPLVGTPIPIANPLWATHGLRRWPGTDPAFMWHPVMWLPDELALQAEVVAPGGAPRLESRDEWATRVAFELERSGLYHPELGWVDVLSLVGLDVDDPRDVARVGAWLHGAPDETLERCSLDAFFADDPTWRPQECFELVHEQWPQLDFADLTPASQSKHLDVAAVRELAGSAA